jgi:hypothetical protein
VKLAIANHGRGAAGMTATTLARPLTAALCREARTLLDWEEGELAFAARVPLGPLQEFERGTMDLPDRALASLRQALERGGVEFTPEAGGRGVRLRKGGG